MNVGARLSDKNLKGEERPWFWNRMKAVAISEAYAALGPEYARIATAMADCGTWLEFGVYQKGASVWQRLRRSNFCRARLCALCQWRRSKLMHQQLCRIVDAHLQQEGRKADRFVFVTLTRRNVWPDELAAELKAMQVARNLLFKYSKVKGAVRGWFCTTEVTVNEDTGQLHPHYHMLLAVRGDYFGNSEVYLEHKEWVALWRQAGKLDYDPGAHVKSVRVWPGQEVSDRTKRKMYEVTKYATKNEDYLKWENDRFNMNPALLEILHLGLKGKNLLAWGGEFVKLRKMLKLQDLDSKKVNLATNGDEKIPEGTELIYINTYKWNMGASYQRGYFLTWRDTPEPKRRAA